MQATIYLGVGYTKHGQKISDNQRECIKQRIAEALSFRFGGVTLSKAMGHWHDPDKGTLVSEPCLKVEVLMPTGPTVNPHQDRMDLITIVNDFKHELQQESVGLVWSEVAVNWLCARSSAR